MTPEAKAIEMLFQVVNKESNEIPFRLTSGQAMVDDNWSRRIVIPKARQRGVTTYFLARSAIRCMGRRNTRAVVISHEAEATERMFARVRRFIETMNGPKPVMKNDSTRELTFPKTNSAFWIGTAGSRKFGRGDFITDLHCSEIAYWPDPKGLMAGLMQAVPASGSISIESTGNGMGNWYHNLCMRAAKGQSSYKMLFLPWWQEGEYTLQLEPEVERALMANLREDLEEPELVTSYGLTAGQIAWRRMKLQDEFDMDLRTWKQEYPACLDDCFQASGGGLFTHVRYVETPLWKRHDHHLHVLEGHPKEGAIYALGGDVGAGVGQDNSVMEVWELMTGEQVGEWISNSIEPDVFGAHLATVGALFNHAYICVESNNHGILSLATLRDSEYPQERIYRTPHGGQRAPKDQVRRVSDLGARTTTTSKPYIIGLLRKTLREEWTVHSPILKAELSSFIEHEDGYLGAAEGCHDDTVIAAAEACYVRQKAILLMADTPVITAPPKPHEIPFTLDSMIEELAENYPGLPFPDSMIDPRL